MIESRSNIRKDFAQFIEHVKIQRSKGSKGNLSWRSIRKSVRKVENRKKLNGQIYHMASSIIPNYFPELILDNTVIANKLEIIRFNSSVNAYSEDPFTQEFKDVIRRINYNKLRNKNKPVPPIDTIKIFTTK